jgi:hypothetical protein
MMRVDDTLSHEERVREAQDRQRRGEIEQREITRWINKHFTSSPLNICAHCGHGPKSGDPFTRPYVAADQADVHRSCHGPWRAAQETLARAALGFEAASLQTAQKQRALWPKNRLEVLRGPTIPGTRRPRSRGHRRGNRRALFLRTGEPTGSAAAANCKRMAT